MADVSSKLLGQFVENLETRRAHRRRRRRRAPTDRHRAGDAPSTGDRRARPTPASASRRRDRRGPAQDRRRRRPSRSTCSTRPAARWPSGWSRRRPGSSWSSLLRSILKRRKPTRPRAIRASDGGSTLVGSNPCSIRPEGRVLGIDPGLSRCGYGAVRARRQRAAAPSACGVIRTRPATPLPERLGRARRPSSTRWSPSCGRRRSRSSGCCSRSTCAPRCRSGRRAGSRSRSRRAPGIPVAQYSPNEVKLAVAGDGGADKAQVQAMVDAAAAASPSCRDPPDAADALALALCHLWRGAAARRRGTTGARGRRRRRSTRRGRRAREGGARGDRLGARARCSSARATGEVLVEVGGVGYRVLVPLGALPALAARRAARSCSRTCTCARTRWCSTASRRATSATRSRC